MPIAPSEAARLTGPLSDYMARIEALIDAQIKGKPHIRSSYYRNPGVSEETLAQLAKAWDVERVDEGIANLYRQANGFQLTWINKKHRFYRAEHSRQLPTSARMPTMQEMEYFPAETGGAFWILPIEEVFNLEDKYEGIFSGAQDLDGSLRLLDGSSNFMPVCCLVKQGEPDPPVFRAEGFGNFGSPWEKLGTVSSYLERKLEGFTQAS